MCNVSPTEYRRYEGIADVSAFEVKGQASIIDFTGPYTNDKTAAEVTKQIEKKLLVNFRRF
jgi:hypothetical protein